MRLKKKVRLDDSRGRCVRGLRGGPSLRPRALSNASGRALTLPTAPGDVHARPACMYLCPRRLIVLMRAHRLAIDMRAISGVSGVATRRAGLQRIFVTYVALHLAQGRHLCRARDHFCPPLRDY